MTTSAMIPANHSEMSAQPASTPVAYSWRLSQSRPTPFFPSRYTFDFAEPGDSAHLAMLLSDHACGVPFTPACGRTRLSLSVLASTLESTDAEWIVARRGKTIVGAVLVRATPASGWHLEWAPAVARMHRHSGIEAYLLHMALLWLDARQVRTVHALADLTTSHLYDRLGGRRPHDVAPAAVRAAA